MSPAGKGQPPNEMVAEGSPEPYQLEHFLSGCGAQDTMSFKSSGDCPQLSHSR